MLPGQRPAQFLQFACVFPLKPVDRSILETVTHRQQARENVIGNFRNRQVARIVLYFTKVGYSTEVK